MLEIMRSGGWLMLPILGCSILAAAIIVERFWSLDPNRVTPKNLMPQVWVWLKNDQLDSTKIRNLHMSSPLGHILAAGLSSRGDGKEAMTESTQRAGSLVIYEMESYLGTLGIIAAICPLLGLLGTVTGMVQVFGEIMTGGGAIASPLAAGISSALLTTAAGLAVAIPAYVFHRYFTRRIEILILNLEQESSKLIESIYTHRKKIEISP